MSYLDDQKKTIQYEWGKVKNVGEEPTAIVLELAYKIHRTAENATGVGVIAKLNGNDINLPTFDILQNVSHRRPWGEKEDLFSG